MRHRKMAILSSGRELADGIAAEQKELRLEVALDDDSETNAALLTREERMCMFQGLR